MSRFVPVVLTSFIPSVVAALGLATAAPAAAAGMSGAPVAIVQEIDATGAKVQMMDYLEAGKTIALGRKGHLVIGYFKSCLNEEITGGTVTVGEEESTLKGGTVKRERVECDGGQMKLSAAQAGKSGVVVMRKAPVGSKMGMATPDIRIYSTRPVIVLSKAGTPITITRLDRPDPPLRIGTTGAIVDLAQAQKGLAIGGLYRAVAGEKSVVFSVDAFANDGAGRKAGPVIGRLIRL